MEKKTVKSKQLEKSLSQIGTLAAIASDEIEKANVATQAASQKLMQLQSEIEQIYITLDEPLVIVSKK